MPSLRLPKRRLLAIAVAASLVAAGAVYALSASRDHESPKPGKSDAPALIELGTSDVTVAKPEARSRTVVITGTLNPLNQIQIVSPYEGRVSEVTARPGDKLAAGQTLAHFDETDLRARYAERKAALTSAEEQMRVAERNRASSRALLDQNFISKNAFDNTLGGYAEKQATLDAQRAQLEIIQRALRDARLVTPLAGMVASRLVEPGQWVEANRKLFTVIDLKHLEIEATVPSQYVAQLKTGQTVSFRTEGYGDETFTGKLTRINPTTQPGTRSMLAYVTVENADERLRAGLYVSGEIVVGTPESIIKLPATAVQARPDGRGVWLVVDGKLKWRALEFERLTVDEVRVTKGLEGGEQVVAMPLKGATEGLAVRVKRPAA
jgi:RND family efflux transporter MFP subunit